MAMKINPPDFNSSSKSFERYKLELQAWKEVTNLPKEKQGIAVALSLPENDECGIRETVFDELALTDLKAEHGLATLITFLENKLGKDDLADSLEKYEDFADFTRAQDQSIIDYIAKFDQKYNRILKKNMTLPPEILAFQLLRRANITREEKLLVLTGMDYNKKDTLYDQAKKSLKKFKGEEATVGKRSSGTSAIKLEPAFLAENEEALLAAGYVRKTGNRWRGGRGRGGFGRGSGYSNVTNTVPSSRPERKMNPNGANGKVLTCLSCGSYRHMLADCPDSWENLAKQQPKGGKPSAENAVLFTGYQKKDIATLATEARNCAVLDSACSSTVCGRNWLNCYVDSLSEIDASKVQREPGVKVFKFGSGEPVVSTGFYQLPAVIAGKEATIRTDVVDVDIPLLLSLKAMKTAKVKMDLEHDIAEIFGETVALNHTSSGHYCVPIDRVKEVSLETVCAVKLHELDSQGRYNTIRKLHRQFAHPPERKLIALMKDAGVWREEFHEELRRIHDECELCKFYAATPPRPVVALPMASRFNEKVAMDLKKWRERWILHLIDMWSRLTVSVFVKRKKPSEIIDKIMTHWVGAAFGVMESILTDNGGEFSSDETREVASIMNIRVCTTAGYSPFQNGLCERVHSVTDMMLMKLEEQYPETPLDVLLCWANMARNSLQMWHGFSSYQLVLGKNPNLPNIMSERLPALEGSTTSEVLAAHLNALHASRKAFIETEASERIRRALRGKVRASEQLYEHRDQVYYKREGQERWLGPGKVVFQDGRVVFVRHGGTFVRVSPNRLIKAGTEFSHESDHDVNNDALAESVDTETMRIQPSDPESKVAETIGDEREEPPHVPVDVQAEPENAQGPVEPQNAQRPAERDEPPHTPVDTQAGLLDYPQGPARPAVTAGTLNNASCLKRDDRVQFKDKTSDPWKTVTVLRRAGKVSGVYNSRYNVKDDATGKDMSVDLKYVQDWRKIEGEETVHAVIVPRCRHGETECMEAKMAELQKLRDFGTYKVVEDQGQTRISTAWVVTQKGDGLKARLVARGFEEESCIQKDSPTVSKSVLRIFLAVAASYGWTVKTTDITSAFLQGNNIDRDVFLTPPKEASAAGKLWKLNRCIYGLNDAARQFYCSVREILLNVGCEQSSLDPAYFVFRKDGQLSGMVACHIDDFLHSGDADFDELIMTKLRERFLAGRLEEREFKYVGLQITQDDAGITLSQNEYVDNLEKPTMPAQRALQKSESLTAAEHTSLRSVVGRLNWVVQNSRPDMSFEMVELSTKFKNGKVEDLLRASKAIGKVKGENASLFFPRLGDLRHVQLLVFSDAALANMCDGVSSMGAHVVFLLGENETCCPLSWHANKIRRVVRSTIAAETLSLQEGLEDGIYLRNLLETTLGLPPRSIRLIAVVDNRSVVEAVHSTKLVDDKRLRLDIGAVKDSLQSGDVTAVKWCPGSQQLADSMTKKGASGTQLLGVFESEKLNVGQLLQE